MFRKSLYKQVQILIYFIKRMLTNEDDVTTLKGNVVSLSNYYLMNKIFIDLYQLQSYLYSNVYI